MNIIGKIKTFFTGRYDPHVRTMQDAYETIRAHFLKQGEQAINGHTCQYRDDQGRMCAIGCLIPDKFYSKGLEGNTMRDSIVATVVARSMNIDNDGFGLDDNLREFLKSAQELHDEADDIPLSHPSILRDLDCIALDYGLNIVS